MVSQIIWVLNNVSILAEHHAPEVYPSDPPVYHYTYSVDDDYTGAQIFADEARDVDHTHGMYEVSFSNVCLLLLTWIRQRIINFSS